MQYFVTGISTEVGKTVVSAILVEALKADYYKPIQAGALVHTDTHEVQRLVSNSQSKFHPSAYALETPMSPHVAAEREDITIDLAQCKPPKTTGDLVIEGAGGLLVPLNTRETILDIIPKKATVIVVSKHYLGSINHTLLTIQALRAAGFEPKLVYVGEEHPSTEQIIDQMTGVTVLGRMDLEPYIDKNVILEYAHLWQSVLKA